MNNTKLSCLLSSNSLHTTTPGVVLDSIGANFSELTTIVTFYTSQQWARLVSEGGGRTVPFDVHSPFFTFSNFAAEKGDHVWLFTNGAHTNDRALRLLIIGLGDQKLYATRNNDHNSLYSFLEAVSLSVDLLLKNKSQQALLYVDNIISDFYQDRIASVIKRIGACLMQSNHFFDMYLSEKKPVLARIDLLVHESRPEAHEQSVLLDEHFQQGKVFGLCSVIAREVANARADDMYPQLVAEYAKLLVDAHSTVEGPEQQLSPSIEILNGDEIKDKGLAMFYAVGQGSSLDSRLVAIKYQGNPTDNEYAVILGKGVTYDTGGLNLKPTGSIENMHLDKGGAAAVLGILKGVISQRAKINVVGVLGLAENAIGPQSYKPHAIIRSLSGKFVRVANTDAEGRLVLADCLTFAQKYYQPRVIIDLATLTGSCAAALGEHFAGIFGNEQGTSLVNDLIAAGKRSTELLWQLPLCKKHVEELKCLDADLNSMGGKYAGASTAAAFLSQFVDEKIPWAHIDIAGPGMSLKKAHWMPEGGTGFGVQVVLEFLFSAFSPP